MKIHLVKKSALFLVVCVCSTKLVFASEELSLKDLVNPAPFSLTVNAIDGAEFDDSRIPDVEFSVGEVELRSTFSALDVASGKLIIGSEFRYSNYLFDSNEIDDNDLYNLALTATYVTNTTSWGHVVRFAPGINSDFKHLNGDDYSVNAFYQARYRKSDRFTWVMGAAMGHQFGEFQLFPLIGAIFQPNEKFRIDFILPSIDINYLANKKQLWHLSLKPAGRSWNVQEESNPSNSVDIVTTEFRLMAGTTYFVNKNLVFKASIGSALSRNLDFTLRNGEEIDLDVENAASISLSVEYRL